MSNSFRIRTKPGVDTSIKVLIDQEFEYLEILSLKVLQSQIYTRQCSDYGVIVYCRIGECALSLGRRGYYGINLFVLYRLASLFEDGKDRRGED